MRGLAYHAIDVDHVTRYGGGTKRSASVPDVLRIGADEHPARLRQSISVTNPSESTLESLPRIEPVPGRSHHAGSKKKPKPSLISVVGLMMFRKLYLGKQRREEMREMARRQSVILESDQSECDQGTPEPEPPQISARDIGTPFLPQNPRFAATLSKEAQFATLQCYEDKILEGLEYTYPSTMGYHWQRLRTKTPKAPRRLNRLTAGMLNVKSAAKC